MYDKIKWLHVEPTTRCNAWCSSCGRNNNGYGLSDFVLEDLDPDRLEQFIDKLPNLKVVQFCGNLGDPCASKLIDQQLKIIKDRDLGLQMHTN
jgi:MoaA/NifB/PqqE/SkfB family radical SAM enzyme